MAKILRPNEITTLSNAGISTSAAASAGGGQVAAGQQVLSVGRASQQSNQLSLTSQVSSMVDAEGSRIFEESKRAHQSATLLNKTTEATEAFISAQTERYKRQTDDNGNPTFDTLHKDVETFGKDILEKTASTIVDPEVAQRFREKFGGYVANQKISALKVATKQQMEFGRSSLDKGLGQLVQQAARDDIDQLGSYEQQGIEALQDALQGGIISYDEYEQRSNEFSVIVREAAIQAGINNDRPRAAQMLSLPAEELGIPEEKKQQLAKTLDAANRSDEIQIEKAKEIQEIDEAAAEASVIEQTQSRIESDSLREDELLSLEDKLEPNTFSSLKKKYISEAKKRAKERNLLRGMATKIARGETLSGESPSNINKLYEYAVNNRQDTTGQPVNLSDKALLAAAIPTAVSAFGKELGGTALYGEVDNADQVLAAYTYIKDRNLPSLDKGFSADAEKVMVQTEFLVERGGMTPKEAMARAREKVLEKNDVEQKANLSAFNKISDFKEGSLEETAASALPGAEGFWGGNRISRDAKMTFKELAREYFRTTPDEDQAIAYAVARMSKTHGVSEISGEKEYMFAPPEKFYPELGSEGLRNILVTEFANQLPEGALPDSVRLSVDDKTTGTIQITGRDADGNLTTREIPTWTVEYVKEVNGQEITVTLNDPKTEQPMRWSPLGTSVIAGQQEQAIEEANRRRQEFLQQQELPGEGPQVTNPEKFGGKISTTKELFLNELDPAVQEETKELPADLVDEKVEKTIQSAKPAQSTFELASAFLGKNETSRDGRTALSSFFKSSMGRNVDPKKTPWCAAFANSVIQANGGQGTGSLMARSFLEWGEPTNEPKEGDVVVLSRGNSPVFGHVGFYAGKTSDGKIKILGGNQNNEVNITAYSSNRLLGYRKAPTSDQIKKNLGE